MPVSSLPSPSNIDPVVYNLVKYGYHHLPEAKKMFPDGVYLVTDSQQQKELLPVLLNQFAYNMGTDYYDIVYEEHGRAPEYDGILGPAMARMFSIPRCGCPDYTEESTEDYLDESATPPKPALTGSGSWNAGCNPKYPGRHSVFYHVDFTRTPSDVMSWWNQIEEGVVEAYAEFGILLVRVENKADAHLHVSWEVLAGSTIGLAMLPGSGHCRKGYFCKLDPGYRPNAVQVAMLLAHELGHNMNSGHITNDQIMHPAIRSGWNWSFKGTAFGRRLIRYFGGEPFPVDPPPPPPTPSDKGLVSVVQDGVIKVYNPTSESITVLPKSFAPDSEGIIVPAS